MCMQSPCRVETHTCPVGRVVCLLGTICLQTMRIPFALCAWALLLAAPLTHGLTVRDPAKLLATPQSVIWRSDRDRAPRAIPNSPLTSGNSGCVEGPEVSPQTTWALSQDLAEPILMKSISPPNSTAKYRVDRREGGHAVRQGKFPPPSATPRWSIFQLMRQSTRLLEHIQDMCVSLSNEEYNIGSFILDVFADAMTNLRDALQLLWGIAAYALYLNYICRRVLPLFAGWYLMRRCERYKYLGTIKSLTFHRRHMRNQAGPFAIYNMMGMTHGQELINPPSNMQIQEPNVMSNSLLTLISIVAIAVVTFAMRRLMKYQPKPTSISDRDKIVNHASSFDLDESEYSSYSESEGDHRDDPPAPTRRRRSSSESDDESDGQSAQSTSARRTIEATMANPPVWGLRHNGHAGQSWPRSEACGAGRHFFTSERVHPHDLVRCPSCYDRILTCVQCRGWWCFRCHGYR